MPRVVIFANGLLPDLEKARRLLGSDDTILCADGGTRHAFALGLLPSAVIGDLDSIGDADRATLENTGSAVHRYPHDKDQTDLELSLRYALGLSPSSILIVGGLGKRLDHTLGNLAMLADPALSAIDCRLDDGVEVAFLCRGRSEIQGSRGDLVSLIPWGAPVNGVSTVGLRWPLRGETLYPEKTRGISNEILEATATVTVESGLLLVIHHRQS